MTATGVHVSTSSRTGRSFRGAAEFPATRLVGWSSEAGRASGQVDLERVQPWELRPDDVVVVVAGQLVPAHGTVVAGSALVKDPPGWRGGAAPARREAGALVRRGARVLSEMLLVRVAPGAAVRGDKMATLEADTP